jgi:hypothetical protein
MRAAVACGVLAAVAACCASAMPAKRCPSALKVPAVGFAGIALPSSSLAGW